MEWPEIIKRQKLLIFAAFRRSAPEGRYELDCLKAMELASKVKP